MSQRLSEEQIKEWIRPIEDPEMRMSLVDLGLVYMATTEPSGKVFVQMTLTSPGCPLADHILDQVTTRLKEHEAIEDAEVELVWTPKWNPKEMASEEAKEKLGLW